MNETPSIIRLTSTKSTCFCTKYTVAPFGKAKCEELHLSGISANNPD